MGFMFSKYKKYSSVVFEMKKLASFREMKEKCGTNKQSVNEVIQTKTVR